MSDRWPMIAELEKKVAAQREQAIRAIKSIQADCPHDKVVAAQDWGGGRRICARCGLEERSTLSWPWRTSDGGLYEFLRDPDQETILNNEFYKRDDVVKYRVKI